MDDSLQYCGVCIGETRGLQNRKGRNKKKKNQNIRMCLLLGLEGCLLPEQWNILQLYMLVTSWKWSGQNQMDCTYYILFNNLNVC